VPEICCPEKFSLWAYNCPKYAIPTFHLTNSDFFFFLKNATLIFEKRYAYFRKRNKFGNIAQSAKFQKKEKASRGCTLKNP